jgi:hypothetical protein
MKTYIVISGIHLVRHGEYVIVNMEVDNQWVKVITEYDPDGLTPFSHIIEPRGIETCLANQNKS